MKRKTRYYIFLALCFIYIESCKPITDFEPLEDDFKANSILPNTLTIFLKDVGDLLIIQKSELNRLGEDSIINTQALLGNIVSGGIDSIDFSVLVFEGTPRSNNSLLFGKSFKEFSLMEFGSGDTLSLSKSLPFLNSENLRADVISKDESTHFAAGLYEGYLSIIQGDSLSDFGPITAIVDKSGGFSSFYDDESDFTIIEGRINLDTLFLGSSKGTNDTELNLFNRSGTSSITNDSFSLHLIVAEDSRNEEIQLELTRKK